MSITDSVTLVSDVRGPLALKRGGFRRTAMEVIRYQSLIRALVVRHMAGRYRGSALGFIWSLLNPLCLMGVYTVVFNFYLRYQSVDNYTFFLFCGLLPWIWTQSALIEGTSSISGSGHLITKSMFPAHILPLVSVITGMLHFLLSLPVLFIFGVWMGGMWSWSLLLLPVVISMHLLVLYGFVLSLATLNVFYRDVQHLVGSLLTFVFFLCPVVYQASTVPAQYQWTFRMNPFAGVIQMYHSILYEGQLPLLQTGLDTICWIAFSVSTGVLCFNRFRDHLAEVL
jgi:lipopolysaccharide transport system permease protein